MPEELTFVDLACLLQVTPDMVLEKFGSAINASIFDASNIAGTLKQKGVVDFTSYYPGPNTIIITEAGKAFINEADAKGAEPFDSLDQIILTQLSGGKKTPAEMQSTLNLRPKDLALRLYKLYKQGFLIYELKSGSVDILMTEKGFLKVSPQMGAAKQQPPKPEEKPMAQQAPAAPTQPATAPQPMQAQASPTDPPPVMPPPAKKKGNPMLIVAVVVIIIIIAAAFYYLKMNGV